MADLIFNVNKFDLVYKDIEQLLVRKISSPFEENGQWFVRVLIELKRTGDYEVQTVESRNINIPLALSQLFDKFLTKQGTTTDVQIINQFIGYINPDIVIVEETPIWEQPVEEDPEEDTEE